MEKAALPVPSAEGSFFSHEERPVIPARRNNRRKVLVKVFILFCFWFNITVYSGNPMKILKEHNVKICKKCAGKELRVIELSGCKFSTLLTF
jgi:hypothetical protein